MKYSPALFLLSLLLTGCDDPTARFDEFTVSHPVNLARVLGSDLTLLGPSDTVHLQVRFDPATRLNRLIDLRDTSLVLEGQAFHHRRLYYVVELREAGSCWVHAVRIRGNEVTGLNRGYRQMEDLSAVVKQGQFGELIRYRILGNDSTRMRFDMRTLRAFYRTELDSFETYRIARPLAARVAETAPAATLSLYPNPANTHATLDFATPATRTVQVYTQAGQLVRVLPAQAATLELPVREWSEGTYILRVTGAESAVQTVRLVVKR
ncbi:T9SS type A sorting domain-containing protein [Hymenobacter algoricola]|uniref:Secretion system C-terminal sorting domain-containing protein n=1 Tax=Hymenobacter algoricola TaxID=486267 RepID=A0ABP7MVK0_9BACT